MTTNLAGSIGYDRAMKRAVLLLLLALPLVFGCRRSATPLGATEKASDPAQTRSPFARVIGSVQDGGFPHAACSGAACRRARASKSSRHATSLALVLPSSEKVYLFDATPDIREQLELIADVRGPLPNGVDRAPIDGVFLSHAHIGHYLGLAFFGYESVHTRGLPVYSTPRMASFLRDNGPWSQLVGKENIHLLEFPPGSKVELEDGVSVTLVASPHREEYTDTVGFLIRGPKRGLLFVPDTDAWTRWSPSIEYWLGQVDVALLDGTFYSRAELPNRSLETIGHPLVTTSMSRFEKLERASTEVLFIHMNHSNPLLLDDSPELAALENRGFELAAEGMEFGL
jgi:pyrroloquinoline quinone biosynthesis protein B